MESAGARILAAAASGIFGLLIGSFLNVVIYRLPRLESIAHPPSHCPACGSQLAAVENIPVLSWLALRGRCRHCAVAISPRYPIVELLTGLLFATIALAAPLAAVASLDAVVAATIAIAAIDLDGERVPPVLEWVALVCSASLLAVSLTHHDARLGWAGIGGGAATAAWGLSVVAAHHRNERSGLPGLPAFVGWGWAAGWSGPAGAVLVGTALVTLVALGSWRPGVRRLTAAAGVAVVTALVVGVLATQ